MGKKILRSVFAWILAILSFIAIVGFGINAIWAILAGAIAGIVYNTVKLSGGQDCALHDAPEADKEVDE